MRLPALASLLAAGLLVTAGPAALAEPNPLQADKQALEQAKLPTDTPALVQFFRDRVPSEELRARVRDLIRQLGSDEFAVREKASAALAVAGPAALPQLRAALNDPDAEVKRRAARCIEAIEGRRNSAVTAAAVRLLAARKPPEAATVLLAYLPEAEDDHIAGEVRAALASLAMRDGKPEPALVEALADKNAIQRAAAGEALGRVVAVRDSVRKLLKDPDATVRLRVGLALLTAKEKDAVPALIGVLEKLPVSAAWETEDALRSLAGEEAPSVPLGEDEAARKKCHDAWAAWWKDNAAKVDLAKYDAGHRLLGYTLLVMQVNKQGGKGTVREISPDGKTRWEINGLGYPLDAHVLPGNRVLIAESHGIIERNIKGEVLWEAKVGSPIACQRLPNGNTFIVTRDRLVEVDHRGREVSSISRGGLMCGMKLRNGQIACIANNRYARLDAKGKELAGFTVNGVSTVGGLDALPDGGIVTAEVFADRVVRYDAAGKEVWHAKFTHPTSVVALRNGRVLVAAWDTGQVAELDAKGKVVWEQKANAEYSRARRR